MQWATHHKYVLGSKCAAGVADFVGCHRTRGCAGLQEPISESIRGVSGV